MSHREKNYKRSISFVDIVLILLFLGLVLGLFLFSVAGRSDSVRVEISSQDGSYIYSLEEDRSLSFYGPLGETVVSIKDGAVDVLDSPGRRKICVNAKPISKHGEWLACLPNKVFLTIRSKNGSTVNTSENGLDAVVF